VRIARSTNKALPKKLFKEGNKLTNQIYSDMLMAEPKDLGLPKDTTELHIIRNHRLAPSFSAYVQDEHGPIDGRLRRIIYRWNGRFYDRGEVGIVVNPTVYPSARAGKETF
jgi:hypothetical protein